MKVVMDDGEEMEFGPGDFGVMQPGHDAWIIGDEPCVVIDWQGYRRLRQALTAGRRGSQKDKQGGEGTHGRLPLPQRTQRTQPSLVRAPRSCARLDRCVVRSR